MVQNDKLVQQCLDFCSLAKEGADKKVDPKAKVRNRGKCALPAEHPKVKDKKDHYPLNNEKEGRAALAYSGHHGGAPSWFSGSLEELRSIIRRKVKATFPSINVSEPKKKASDVLFNLVSKYGQAAAAPPVAPTAPTPVSAAPTAPTAATAVPAPLDPAAKATAITAAQAAVTATKAAAEAATKAAADAVQKLKALQPKASLDFWLSKYSQHSDAPSAQVRSWKPGNDTPAKDPPTTINNVEGNNVPDDSATKANAVGGNNVPDDSATKHFDDSPSNGATKNINEKKSDKKDDVSDAADDKDAGGNGGNGATSTEVKSPTSTEVRSPTSTSTEVRSPTSTSTEVRSPTSTSTEAYTADNFTATVTGGAGAGAYTVVNIYPGQSAKPGIKEKAKQSSMQKLKLIASKYGQGTSSGTNSLNQIAVQEVLHDTLAPLGYSLVSAEPLQGQYLDIRVKSDPHKAKWRGRGVLEKDELVKVLDPIAKDMFSLPANVMVYTSSNMSAKPEKMVETFYRLSSKYGQAAPIPTPAPKPAIKEVPMQKTHFTEMNDENQQQLDQNGKYVGMQKQAPVNKVKPAAPKQSSMEQLKSIVSKYGQVAPAAASPVQPAQKADPTAQLNQVLAPFGYSVLEGSKVQPLDAQFADVRIKSTPKSRWSGKGVLEKDEVQKLINPVLQSTLGLSAKPLIYT